MVEEARRLAVVERPVPEPGRGEVRVRVRYAGIYGSDVHILHGRNPFVVYPRVIGREIVGLVESVGRDVPPQRVGERVAVDPEIACGSCYPCSIGRPNVCHRLQVLGVHPRRRLKRPPLRSRRQRSPGPPGIPDAAAATIEPREPLPEAQRRLGVDGGPTLVIDAVCHPAILEEALRVAAPAGRIGMLGFSSEPSAIPQQETTRKELSLFASRLNAGTFPQVIEWMKSGRLQPERIVSHRVPLAEVGRAFELTENDPRSSSKVLLDFGPQA